MKGVALIALVLSMAAGQARAEERPPTTPTRDVDVIYRIAGPNAPLAQRLRWGVTLGKLRVDPPSPGMYVIIDTATHAMLAVREGDRSVLEIDAGGPATPRGVEGIGPDANGSFTRRGTATVAGLDCTQWETKDTGGRAVVACLTPDGVLLRAEADGLVLVQALAVHFEPQLDAVFRVPTDYRRVTPPPPPAQRR